MHAMIFEFTHKRCDRVWSSINIFVCEAQIVAHKSSFDVVSSVINYMETLFEVFIFEHYDYERKSTHTYSIIHVKFLYFEKTKKI